MMRVGFKLLINNRSISFLNLKVDNVSDYTVAVGLKVSPEPLLLRLGFVV